MLLSSNVTHMYIRHYLDKYTTDYQDSMDKLSSGIKYNTIQDDPVSYSRTALIDQELNANDNIISNLETGSALLNVAAGAQEQVLSNIQNIRELCVQALNGTYSADNKDAIISNIRGSLDSINNIADTTTFGSIKLLDGSCTSMVFQLSPTSGDVVDVSSSFSDVHTKALGIDLDSTATGSTWTDSDINNYMQSLDKAYNSVLTSNAKVGGYSSKFDQVIDNLNNLTLNLTETRSELTDTDVALESSNVVRYQILQESAINILAQANQMIPSVLALLPSS